MKRNPPDESALEDRFNLGRLADFETQSGEGGGSCLDWVCTCSHDGSSSATTHATRPGLVPSGNVRTHRPTVESDKDRLRLWSWEVDDVNGAL
jgi:hypothetical protein